VGVTKYWPRLADPLGEALHALRMGSSLYTRSEVTAPWVLALPALAGHLMFHIVTAASDGLDPAQGVPCPATAR
jgi:hypothetical protein